MSSYSVIQRQVCAVCEGTGTVTTAIWDLYWEENPEGLATPEEVLDWLQEQGWDVSSVADLPLDIEACIACAGMGEVCEEVPLLQALTDLGLLPALEAFVRAVRLRAMRSGDPDRDLAGAAEALLEALSQAQAAEAH